MLYRTLSSQKFFYVIVGLLLLQASWFALTVKFPMAFDEDYHFGIIQFYSHQWLPFFSQQPPHSEAYGDLVRYDSYMFHYIMSFPYRLIAAFAKDQVTQIIILRFINIGLFVAGMFFFRNALRRLDISTALTNFLFLLFIFIPVVPFLAATINYDNLAFVIVPLLLGFALTCGEAMRKGKLLPLQFILLFAVGTVGSLTKYAFTPIFATVLAYLFILFLRSDKRKKILVGARRSFSKYNVSLKILLVLIVVVSVGLLGERYGTNILRYHRYEPSCEQVRTVSDCLQYGPWERDYMTGLTVDATNPPHDPAIPLFLPVWVGNYVYRLYFAINYDYATYDPLPIPYYTAYVVGIFGLLLCLFFWKKIKKINRDLVFAAVVITIYTASLIYVNLTSYLGMHTIVAANGRYLIIILPLLFAIIGLAYRAFFIRIFKQRAHTMLIALSAVVLVLMLNGGGAGAHLLRMSPDGYWQNTPAPSINTVLKGILSPIIIGD